MQFSSNEKIRRLVERSKELGYLTGVTSLLEWDQETYMPVKAGDARSHQLALISGIAHERLVDTDNKKLLEDAQNEISKAPDDFTDMDKALVREFKRDYDRATKLPTDFVKELTELTSKSLEVWKKAKETNDFRLFQPYLEKIVEMKIREAEYVGYQTSPYDALADEFEPGITEAEIESTLTPLRDFTIDFLKKIQTSSSTANRSLLTRNFDVEKQLQLSREISKGIGYDFEAGNLALSSHPFTTEFATSSDVRITTRVKPTDLAYSMMSTIHEVGHALYEQGVDKAMDSTHLGEGTSLGIHESQSRMWENIVGRNHNFWKYWYPKVCASFPESLKETEQESFVQALNSVSPSFIRTEADEVTYNLHIVIRFEIETALIKQKLKVADLPSVWNEKMHNYLGITPPNDTLGVLQDIHWAMGAIGYFHTYSLGNIYAAQFWNAIKTQIPDIEENIAKGNTNMLLNWLRTNIHQYGKIYSAKELCQRVTGESLTSKYLMKYLQSKFSNLLK